MWEDEIVEKTRRTRKAYAAQFEDLVAMCRDLQQKEAESKHKLVSFLPRRPVVIPVHKHVESAVAEEKGKCDEKKSG